MTRFKLGINTGFAINRFPEPEVWTRIVREELGLTYVQFTADLLNPFLPEEIIKDQFVRLKACIRRYELEVDTTFTSAFTRVNHLLHPDAATRRVWLGWFKKWAEISAELGARGMGSHFGIFSVTDYQAPDRRAVLLKEAVRSWQELAQHCRGLGMEFLIFEPMSVPRELGWTMEETRELLAKLNNGAAIPMKLCLDIGHAPHPDERDPYIWLESFASTSPVIHLQQTEFGHSRHWPFTREYNEKGIIKAERVLEVINRSGVEEVMLAFEISHRERIPDDLRVIDDLRESVAYWKRAIEEFGS